MYYNTTGETGTELKKSRAKAQTQSEIIMELYNSCPIGLSPSDVLGLVDNRWPITSIRRAISDLTAEGLLEKTDTRKQGIYGKAEHVWRKSQAIFCNGVQSSLFG